MRKSYLIETLELKHGKPIREILREQFATGKNQGEIAGSLGISYWTLRSLLYRLKAEVTSTVRFRGEEERALFP